uniref:Uncharacterized protein n=1 Tax=viral metagenome TaxID=1070528 RepID=A0A6H1ZGC2_9ZZZZ
MTQELTVRQTDVGIFLPPDIVLENARTAANALKQVISLKSKPVILNGEQYLEMEDWELCGQFYGYTVKTGNAEQVEIDGVKGAKAHADLVDMHTGLIIGGAEAYCMRDEEHWNTRPKYEWQGEGANRRRVLVGQEVVPWFQLASMAQTRAGAKAFRNRLAWVVVLAGYRPTPAEEMTEGTVSEAVAERRTVDKSDHYCKIHNVNFFKKGKMKNYAHPIEGTDSWCSEANKPPKSELVSGPVSDNAPVEEETPPGVDVMSKEALLKMVHKDLGDFYQACYDYLNMSKSVVDMGTTIFDKRDAGQRQRAWAELVEKHYGKEG